MYHAESSHLFFRLLPSPYRVDELFQISKGLWSNGVDLWQPPLSELLGGQSQMPGFGFSTGLLKDRRRSADAILPDSSGKSGLSSWVDMGMGDCSGLHSGRRTLRTEERHVADC